MNGLHALRTVLVADAALIALVPSAKIGAAPLPQGTQAPYIALQTVSGVDLNTPSIGSQQFVTDRVQATIVADDYDEKDAILAALRNAASGALYPTVSGITGVTIHTEGRGADGFDEDTGLFIAIQDLRVKYMEPRT